MGSDMYLNPPSRSEEEYWKKEEEINEAHEKGFELAYAVWTANDDDSDPVLEFVTVDEQDAIDYVSQNRAVSLQTRGVGRKQVWYTSTMLKPQKREGQP